MFKKEILIRFNWQNRLSLRREGVSLRVYQSRLKASYQNETFAGCTAIIAACEVHELSS